MNQSRTPTGSDSPPSVRTSAWFRLAVVSVVAATAAGAIALIAYQIALGKVPQHRAALERLVRARTGLDVAFNELGLRWGWYGPEAVFREVELGEPGRARALRARELIVGLDAWRSVQSGQLEAGRITLVAPDIDVAQLGESPAQARGVTTGGGLRHRADELLARWPNGRIDIDGGTLSWPDPRAPTRSIRIAIGRAVVRRAGQLWSASAQLFPPETLGRSVQLSLDVAGDPGRESSQRAALKFHGRDLALAGWSDILGALTSAARYLPSAGIGSIGFELDWKNGRVSGASGELSAENLTLGSGLRIGTFSGAWKLARSGKAWRMTADRLDVGALAPSAARASAVIDFDEAWSRASGTVISAPVELLVSAAEWGVPGADLRPARLLRGTAPRVEFDWLSARPVGLRLHLSGTIDELGLVDAAAGFAVSGARALFAGTESDLLADVSADDARLALAAAPSRQIRGLRLAGKVRFQRDRSGWQLATEGATIEHARSRLQLRAGVRAALPGDVPAFALHANLTDGDVETLDMLLGTPLQAMLGPAAARVRSGRIVRAEVDWEGIVSRSPAPPRTLRGSLELADGSLAASGTWPALQGVAGRLQWRGDVVRATVDRASAGPLELSALEAEWHATNAGGARFFGRGEGNVADVLAWLRRQPDLDAFASAARDLDARGRALYSFDVTLPAGEFGKGARVRLVTRLEAAEVRFASQLPPLQAVNGTLTFDSGHLLRSTLDGEWLGGVTVLHLEERRPRGMPELWLQAQGTMDARRLLAAAGVAGMLGPVPAQVGGRSAWKGELGFVPQLGAWRVHGESSLTGIWSRLPAPLAKSDALAAPLRLTIEGERGHALLHLTIADSVRGLIELTPRTDGTWQPVRGGLRFGGGLPLLGHESTLELSGRLARVEVCPWLLAFRTLAASGNAPVPLRVSLAIDDLVVAGQSYAAATVDAEGRLNGSFDLRIQADELAGVAHSSGDGSPTEVQLGTLTVPRAADPLELATALGALGPEARVSATTVLWQGHALGSLAARVRSSAAGISIEPLELSGANGEAQGTVRCAAATLQCHATFELSSRDAAATLRDFGFRDDLSARHAALAGELDWPVRLSPERSWLSSLTGRLTLALSEGSTRVASAADEVPFPLLAVSLLLGDSRGSRAAFEGSSDAERLEFAQLAADYELRDGAAYTSNLHFDGDAEIVMTGRSGLASGDYDYRAWILRGEDRLPSAVRRLAAAPHLAAAWLALRDLVSGPADGPSRAELHLGGTWDAPVVGPVR